MHTHTLTHYTLYTNKHCWLNVDIMHLIIYAAVVSFDQSSVSTDGVLREAEDVGTTNIILVLSKPVDEDATITVRTTDITATGKI